MIRFIILSEKEMASWNDSSKNGEWFRNFKKGIAKCVAEDCHCHVKIQDENGKELYFQNAL